ncbi:MAG: hypothetical protein WAW37_18105 [Syntrophobacteraceae bacterium]
MKTFSWMFLLILLGWSSNAISSNLSTVHQNCTGGIWAAEAQSPYAGANLTPTTISAPNGRLSIIATGIGLSLVDESGKISRLPVLPNPSLTEVLWAPDSSAFVINVSDGGLVGTWEAAFFFLDAANRPIRRDIQRLVMPAANKLLLCDPDEVANIGVASWVNGSSEVLVIAEVPPHSSCRNMGSIFGFLVSVESYQITKRIAEDNLRKRWANTLGCRFMKINGGGWHR